MSPRVFVARAPLPMRLAITVGLFILAAALSLLVTRMTVLGNHPQPTLPLTAPIVQALSACNGAAGVSIPTGQRGSANVEPDRNNTSSSNEALAGTAQTFVIHANAEQDLKELTLDISGSHLVFDGLLNSRSHAKVGGSWNQFRHGFEYGQRSESSKPAFDLTGSNNCFEGPGPVNQPGDPAGAPEQAYENAPPAVPAGFPLFSRFDPDQDGNILEHFAPGSPAANAAMTDPAPGTQYFVCGIPDPDGALPGAAIAPGCSGSGASAIMDRNVQGQTLQTGLYFVTGRAKLSASNLDATITIVSGQQLNVNGSFQGQGFSVFKPYTDATGARPPNGQVLFASQWDEAANLSGAPDGRTFPDGNPANDSPNTDKAEDALKIEGSLSRFEGIIVATNGRTEIAGEQMDFRCPVMGDRVRLNGSKNYFNSTGCAPAPSVSIDKIPDGANAGTPVLQGTISVGDTAVFRITVTNAVNAATATNVDIEDTLVGHGWTTDQPAACTITPSGANDLLHCDVPDLVGGASFTVNVSRTTTTADCVGDPPGAVGARLDNGSLTGDPASVELSDTVVDTDPGHLFVNCPEVTINKIPDGANAGTPVLQGTINAGDNAVFRITVSNAAGAATATGLTIEDTLVGHGWTSDQLAACTITPDGANDALACNVPDLAGGASFVVNVSRATTTADCVGDTSSGTGIRLDNGSLTGDPAAVLIDGTEVDNDPGHLFVNCPDAGVSKTPDDGTVDAGENIVFTITVTANGPGPSPNVVLTDELPTGFLWTLGGADEADCDADTVGDPQTYQGGVTLTCDFGTIAFPGSRTITLTAPTSGADCGDTVENTAVITGDGDTVALNNSDPADVTVECGALMILKESTKTGNPLVSQTGTRFSATGPFPAAGSFTVRDNNTGLPAGSRNDADTTVGEVCIENVEPGTYTIAELDPPNGYGSGTAVDATALVVSGTDCTDNQPAVNDRAVFRNPPLADIQVRFRDGGSTETFLDAAGITCDNVTGTSSNADTDDWDDTLTVEDIHVTAATITVECTIVIDP